MSEGRIAVRFSRDARLRDMTHLEALRVWEAALKRSSLPVAQTEGRSPRPRFALAAPLPTGYTSEAEWLQLHLAGPAQPAVHVAVGPKGPARFPLPPPESIFAALNAGLPPGMRALEVLPMDFRAPSLQSQLRWAEYRMTMGGEMHPDDLDRRIEDFFRRDSFPWEETIEGKTRRFDLRDLVDEFWVEQSEGGVALGMRLEAARSGAGRPDSVLAGLGLHDVVARHRTRLLFSHLPHASLLWRLRGRFEDQRPER